MPQHLAESIPVGEWLTTTDIFAREYWKKYNGVRQIHKIWVTGSAAQGDTGAVIEDGPVEVGTFYLTSTGFPAMRDEEYLVSYRKKFKAPYTLFPSANATTNAVVLQMLVTP